MRSTSCGVLIEPSTSDRSYGPLATAREASTKLQISISPATASSSSSQSSRLNWQPSHDANFPTPSFVFLCLSILQLTDSKPVRDAVIAEDRAIFADELRAELTVAAKADGTLHVAFHRQENVFGKHSALLQLKYRVSHHHLGAA